MTDLTNYTAYKKLGVCSLVVQNKEIYLSQNNYNPLTGVPLDVSLNLVSLNDINTAIANYQSLINNLNTVLSDFNVLQTTIPA